MLINMRMNKNICTKHNLYKGLVFRCFHVLKFFKFSCFSADFDNSGNLSPTPPTSCIPQPGNTDKT